jgi:hypothetical protein
MSSEAESRTALAESVAAVACGLQERLIAYLAEHAEGRLAGWPAGDFHAPFGGFPGWWAFCADLGAAAETHWAQVDSDDWIGFVDDVVETAFAAVVAARGPLPPADLVRHS